MKILFLLLSLQCVVFAQFNAEVPKEPSSALVQMFYPNFGSLTSGSSDLSEPEINNILNKLPNDGIFSMLKATTFDAKDVINKMQAAVKNDPKNFLVWTKEIISLSTVFASNNGMKIIKNVGDPALLTLRFNDLRNGTVVWMNSVFPQSIKNLDDASNVLNRLLHEAL